VFEKVQAAAQRLRGQAHHTPVMTSRTLNTRAGAEVFLKCENLQRVGAFKFRGAYNAISQLSDAQKACGVLAFSSGNHAQAVALVGTMLGVKTTIVMPDNAPITKREATAGYGGEVILYDPITEDREKIATLLAEQYGYSLIPPYNNENVLLGQGTASLELHEEIANLDMLFTPVGGGGLLSGSAIASKGINPSCKVIGVEPAVANDAYLSFKSKTLHTIKNPPTIADGTRTPSLGSITFPLVLEYVDDFCVVSEEAIKEAVRFLFYHLKIVVEPSGVLGVAALLSGAIPVSGRVGVILSGGNIDAPTMTAILSEG
jgi:threo-3-hydroxy-L-aspartate ammonia-lyase